MRYVYVSIFLFFIENKFFQNECSELTQKTIDMVSDFPIICVLNIVWIEFTYLLLVYMNYRIRLS